jgi:hypothetical protein
MENVNTLDMLPPLENKFWKVTRFLDICWRLYGICKVLFWVTSYLYYITAEDGMSDLRSVFHSVGNLGRCTAAVLLEATPRFSLPQPWIAWKISISHTMSTAGLLVILSSLWWARYLVLAKYPVCVCDDASIAQKFVLRSQLIMRTLIYPGTLQYFYWLRSNCIVSIALTTVLALFGVPLFRVLSRCSLPVAPCFNDASYIFKANFFASILTNESSIFYPRNWNKIRVYGALMFLVNALTLLQMHLPDICSITREGNITANTNEVGDEMLNDMFVDLATEETEL